MKDLLEAFTIFAKYIRSYAKPTSCEHDVLYVLCDPDEVSAEDELRLMELGFIADPGEHHYYSFRYGAA